MNDERFKKLFSEQMNKEFENLEKFSNILPLHDFSENFENKMQKIFENVGKFNFSIKNRKYKNPEESSDRPLLNEFSKDSENEDFNNKEQDSVQSKRKRHFITLNTFSKKVAFAAVLAVMVFGAYFPVKSACSSIYNHVIDKTHNQQDIEPDETSVTEATEATDPVITDNIKGKEHTAFGMEYPVMTQTYATETETAVYTTVKTEIITNDTTIVINTEKNSTTTTVVKKNVRDSSNVIKYVGNNNPYRNLDAGHLAISYYADIPSDYDSAESFYFENGETAMMEEGNKAIIVLPAASVDKSCITEAGINITSCSTYYKSGMWNRLSFDVYCIEFDKMKIQEGDKACIKFSGYAQTICNAPSFDYIELCYKHIENGIFELEKMPTTIRGAEKFISNNGKVGTFGNQICMVYSNCSTNKYLAENMEGETSDRKTVTINPENREVKYYDSDYSISSYSFELEKAGEYTVDVVDYRIIDKNKDLVYAESIDRYYFSYDGNTICKNEVMKCLVGDVNLDGCVDIYDAFLINNYLLGKAELTELQFALTDVNYDGKTDVNDVILMLGSSSVKCWKDYNNDGIVDKKDWEAIINSFIDSDKLVEKLYANKVADLNILISEIRIELYKKYKSLK